MSTVFWDEGRPFPLVLHVKRGAEIRRYVPERTAAVEVSHGDHGPEPRFVGDVWTMHHACSACGGGRWTRETASASTAERGSRRRADGQVGNNHDSRR